MIIYKTDSEIALMKEAAMLVSKTLAEVAKVLKPGMTTLQIDKLCADFIKQNNAISNFLNYRGYPFTICASVNDFDSFLFSRTLVFSYVAILEFRSFTKLFNVL